MRAARWFGDRGPHLASPSDIREFALRGLWTTACCAGLSPEFLDLERCDPEIDTPLIVPSGAAMSADLQRRLAALIEGGARVFLAPVVPYLDNDLRPCAILAQALGLPAADLPQQRLERPSPRVSAWNEPNVFVNGPLFAATTVPQEAQIKAVEQRTGSVIGWSRALGRGRVTILGLQWIHARREHASMLSAALRELGIASVLRVDNPLVWAVLRTDGRRWLLFLLNLFTAAQRVRVTFFEPASDTSVDTGVIEVAGMSVTTWPRG